MSWRPARLVTSIVVLGLVIGGGFSAAYLKKKLDERNLDVKNLKRQDISITIIEGKRREEIAAQLAALGITSASDFLNASKDSEGYLFPDTYRFYPNTPASEVVATLRANFEKRVGDLNPSAETMALASIVERESINDTDRPIIAAVYRNRLKIGMKLQSDPTVEYGKATNDLALHPNPSAGYAYWPIITRADYQNVNSPFNTYLIDALPPTPICSPGRKSIEAALNPDNNDYLFFGYKNGKLLLSTSLAQHEAQLR